MSAATLEKRIVTDEKCTCPPLHQGGEGTVDFNFAVGLEDMNLLPNGASRGLYISRPSLGIGIVRVEEHSDIGGCRQQLAQHFQPLRRQFPEEQTHSCGIADWPVEAG